MPSLPRRARATLLAPAVALIALSWMLPDVADAARRRHEAIGFQLFTSPLVNPIALAPGGGELYVANTTTNTVSVIDTGTLQEVTQIEVGIDPSGVAVRPDGLEVWVTNHVSDSVSVIDTNPASPSYRTVIATVSSLDANRATTFDEPTGIAFADNTKAYVALSSINDVAVVDVATRAVTGRIHITNQEPRALAVRNGRLYVAAFESGNQSELSACPDPDAPGSAPQCTMDLDDLVTFVVQSPNVPGSDARIVKDPDVPDRDVFVFSTVDESPVDTVTGVGTLLYGITVSGSDQVFVAQVDARNEVNGLDSDELADLDNRMFLNQIASIGCGGGSCGAPAIFELEPLPPAQPALSDALATPYGIALSNDDSTLVVTAAGTSRVFTVNPTTGAVLDILDLDAGVPADAGQQIPKGVALVSDGGGAPQRAYVLNSLENTVSVVDVTMPGASLTHVTKIGVGNDPTPDAVRRGRIAFNNAFASTSGTFSCESCHPDGNADQLLWRIGGDCDFCGSRVDEVRSTMPVRGLKNTLPLHWDGTLGDPFGGPNGQTGSGGNGGSDCSLGGPDGDADCFRALVDSSLAGVMCQQGNGPNACQTGPSGLDGELTNAERDDMGTFLASVAYPPARSRPMDDLVTDAALEGFGDFFVDFRGSANIDLGDLLVVAAGASDNVDTCADMDSGCHALPLGADTNSVTLGGFDVPTMRGMTDRFLQFSIGITNTEEAQVFAQVPGSFMIPGIPFAINYPASDDPWNPADGFEEGVTFASAFIVFNPIYGSRSLEMFQMFEEASTGHSGAIGRQLTISQATTTGGNLAETEAQLDLLEAADANGLINLQGTGTRNGQQGRASYQGIAGNYLWKQATVSRATLIADAQADNANITLTAFLPRNFGSDDYRQPLLAPSHNGPRVAPGTPCNGSGQPPCTWINHNPDLPILPGDNPMTLRGTDVRSDAVLWMDGAPTGGSISCVGGSFTPYCDSGMVQITLSSIPVLDGPHLLQVQNPKGPVSPELVVCVGDLLLCNTDL